MDRGDRAHPFLVTYRVPEITSLGTVNRPCIANGAPYHPGTDLGMRIDRSALKVIGYPDAIREQVAIANRKSKRTRRPAQEEILLPNIIVRLPRVGSRREVDLTVLEFLRQTIGNDVRESKNLGERPLQDIRARRRLRLNRPLPPFDLGIGGHSHWEKKAGPFLGELIYG